MERAIGQSPDLAWEAGGVPFASEFGDSYFGAQNALHEIAHVFLNGTGLWQCLVAGPSIRPLQIGETGFGTGLNFCAAVQLWLACRDAGVAVPPLHFTSVEAWPLAKADLAKVLSVFPEVAKVARPLVEAWPDGFNAGDLFSASFFGGNVRLTLKIDKAAKGLNELTIPGGVDLWFLDGFAPDRNPEMWGEDVMAALGRLSAPGARLATFTSAGHVRRALADAGFEVSRIKGFGRKRHMTVAEFSKRRVRPKAPMSPAAHAVSRPRLAIIGGGLAGHLLAERARHYLPQATITLFDPAFDGGNAPPLANVVPRLDVGQAAHNWLMPKLFHSAVSYWQALAEAADQPALFRQIGARYLAPDEKARQRAGQALCDFGGKVLEDDTIFWSKAGVVDRDLALAALRQKSQAQIETRHIADPLALSVDYDHILLANGPGAAALLPETVFPATGRAGSLCAFEVTHEPTQIHFGNGHVLPAGNGQVWAGASFHHWPLNGQLPTPQALAGDAALCAAKLPWALGHEAGTPNARWAGLRVVLPDQLPMAGRLPNWRAMAEAVSGLRHGQWLNEAVLQAAFNSLEGPQVHILAGSGARGFMWLPFLADHVIRGLAGLPGDGGEAVFQAISPWRFLLRAERYSRLDDAAKLPDGPVQPQNG